MLYIIIIIIIVIIHDCTILYPSYKGYYTWLYYIIPQL